MADQNFTVRRGDTIVFTVTVTRAGSAVNLTGGTLWFTAKRSIDDSDSVAVLKADSLSGAGHGGIALTTPASGIATITLQPSATTGLTAPTALVYDVQLQESDGTISTVATGVLTVVIDVTQRTT